MSQKLRALLSLRTVAAVGVFAMLAVTATIFVGGVAKANNWSGRAEKYGYFDNQYGDANSPYPDGRGPVIDNNDYAALAIPYSVNTKDALYNFLVNKYNNPGTYGHASWDKTGVSFIVNTMIGNDPNASSRTVTAAMWTQLHEKLFSDSVDFKVGNVSAGAYGGVNTYYQYGNNDVAWYNDPSEGGQAITLSVNGTVDYVLLYKCANPLGSLAGLPEPPHWTVSTSTSATTKNGSGITPPLASDEVIPGSIIKWTHDIINEGPDATDTDVLWHYNNSNGWSGSGPTMKFGAGKAKGATTTSTFTYKVLDSDLGKTLCQSTWAQPHAWNDPGTTESAPVCFKVVYRYELHPSATVGGSGTSVTAEAGTTIDVGYSVTNSGPTLSQATTWQLTQCIYAPTATIPSSTGEVTNGLTGKQFFGSGSCNVAKTGSSTFAVGTDTLGTTTVDTSTYAAGTHICYALSVNPPSATVAGWRHSQLACIAIVKYPKIQALGGDIRAKSVATHTPTNLSGKYYGSWSQYGIFGIAGISGMASGGTLAGGASTNNASLQKALTFANTPGLGGFYSTPPPANATYTALWAQRPPGLPAGPATAAYSIVPNGTTDTVYVNGNLTINSDIVYSGNYASPADIPRIIYVVNGNIIINASVQRIDAWLVTDKTLFTCSDDAGGSRIPLTVDKCVNQLTFNGPVDAHDTRLSRTYGADGNAAAKGEASEIFNLDPSIYLSTYSAGISDTNIRTDYEKELPPRW